MASGLGFNQQSEIVNQQLLRVCEEVRDRRHGESSLPPAAGTLKLKRRTPCHV
jgi:hypothetical protein